MKCEANSKHVSSKIDNDKKNKHLGSDGVQRSAGVDCVKVYGECLGPWMGRQCMQWHR